MAGIDHKDFMHGAALLAIADSPGFTALNRASVKYGHYVVNHDRHVFVKYCDEKRNAAYSFTYTASDKDLFIDGMEHETQKPSCRGRAHPAKRVPETNPVATPGWHRLRALELATRLHTDAAMHALFAW